MGWYKAHSTMNNDRGPVVDRCINCGHHKEIKTTITMEFGEGNYNTGPISRNLYSNNWFFCTSNYWFNN